MHNNHQTRQLSLPEAADRWVYITVADTNVVGEYMIGLLLDHHYTSVTAGLLCQGNQ